MTNEKLILNHVYRLQRNHQTLTERFDDFFHYVLYEAPEKYENKQAVVVAEAYTRSFMVSLVS